MQRQKKIFKVIINTAIQREAGSDCHVTISVDVKIQDVITSSLEITLLILRGLFLLMGSHCCQLISIRFYTQQLLSNLCLIALQFNINKQFDCSKIPV